MKNKRSNNVSAEHAVNIFFGIRNRMSNSFGIGAMKQCERGRCPRPAVAADFVTPRPKNISLRHDRAYFDIETAVPQKFGIHVASSEVFYDSSYHLETTDVVTKTVFGTQIFHLIVTRSPTRCRRCGSLLGELHVEGCPYTRYTASPISIYPPQTAWAGLQLSTKTCE